MAKILTRYSNNNEQLNVDSFINKLNQKIYTLGKKILSYVRCNQHAFAAGLWSYLFIEVGMVACQMTFGDEYIKDVESCQRILCDHWNPDIATNSAFFANLEFQCNSSNYPQNLLPTYSFDTCINNLCEYMSSIGKKIYGCNIIFNQNNSEANFDISNGGIPYYSKPVYKLWEEICPSKQNKYQTIDEQAAYINDCVQRLCAHSFKLNIKLDKTLINWCQNLNINNLYKLLGNLTQIVLDSKEKSEDSESWMKANVIASLLASLTAITASIVTLVATLISIRGVNPSLISNLNNLVNSASQTVETIFEMSTFGEKEIIPKERLNTLSELTDSLSYYSTQSIEDFSLENPKINVIPAEDYNTLGDIGIKTSSEKLRAIITGAEAIVGSVIGIASSGEKGGGGIEYQHEKITETPKTTRLITNIVRSTIDKVDMTPESIIYTEQEPNSFSGQQININEIFQQYLDDYIVNYLRVPDIISKQVFRLKNSLDSWQNALCLYVFPNNLACQFPIPNSYSATRIPIEKLKDMFSENPIGLCYVFQNQLWCNWDKFLNIVSYTRSSSMNFFNCYSDQIFLSVRKNRESFYQLTLQGEYSGCYNETALIRI